jgi:hypothetical protein
MSRALPPRAVVVVRPTERDELLQRHGTRAMAAFFLASRGRSIDDVEAVHRVVVGARDAVLRAIPLAWRRALVQRDDLDRFLFQPEDVIVTVGQDGLVANVAKYLDGQLVVGINPSPALFDGVLARHPAMAAEELLRLAAEGSRHARVEERTMVEARTPDGQRLVALNEIFVGHRSHQSARYTLSLGKAHERHSSSGIVVATGTGATSWARSIHQSRHAEIALPTPTARELVFFVREAFPSVATGTSLVEGAVAGGEQLAVSSEMNDGGVVFGDGLEDDHLVFPFGQNLTIGAAQSRLRLLAA